MNELKIYQKALTHSTSSNQMVQQIYTPLLLYVLSIFSILASLGGCCHKGVLSPTAASSCLYLSIVMAGRGNLRYENSRD